MVTENEPMDTFVGTLVTFDPDDPFMPSLEEGLLNLSLWKMSGFQRFGL